MERAQNTQALIECQPLLSLQDGFVDKYCYCSIVFRIYVCRRKGLFILLFQLRYQLSSVLRLYYPQDKKPTSPASSPSKRPHTLYIQNRQPSKCPQTLTAGITLDSSSPHGNAPFSVGMGPSWLPSRLPQVGLHISELLTPGRWVQ